MMESELVKAIIGAIVLLGLIGFLVTFIWYEVICKPRKFKERGTWAWNYFTEKIENCKDHMEADDLDDEIHDRCFMEIPMDIYNKLESLASDKWDKLIEEEKQKRIADAKKDFCKECAPKAVELLEDA
jgi:hypothetical protein